MCRRTAAPRAHSGPHEAFDFGFRPGEGLFERLALHGLSLGAWQRFSDAGFKHYEVEKPGFYAVPGDIVLGDALMRAGGLTREAKFKALQIDREGQSIWRGESLQTAIADGRTIDQLGLRGGDRIVIPRQMLRDPESTIRIISILVALPVAIFAATHLGGGR